MNGAVRLIVLQKEVSDIVNRIKSELSALYDKNEVESFVSLLLHKICGLSTVRRLMADDIVVTNEQTLGINDAIDRLKRYEPIQYILGETEFYGLTLQTDRRALIPRPETEELVDWIVHECSSARRILDVCTGSGCIAVGLAKNLTRAKVEALDVSADALSLARDNARRHGVDIVFHRQDILAAISLSGKFDIIVSNPPYVTLSERQEMRPNVLNYEPALALFVSDDAPLLFYRAIADFAQKSLNPNGLLFFEINRRFGNLMADILSSAGFVDIVSKKDMAGNDRFIRCRI